MGIILGIIILLLVIILVIILRQSTQKSVEQLHLLDRISKIEMNISQQYISSQHQLVKEMNYDFERLNQMTEKRLIMINQQLNDSFEKNFTKTNDAFLQMMTRLEKIDQAQQKIDALSIDIVSLQNVLTDKKVRGVFGELQLENILKAIFGQKNDLLYKIQYNLSNGTICDAIVFAPKPLGSIVIDSKFPLENYKRLVNSEIDAQIRTNAHKQFVVDVKKHIDAIATKYIIIGETSNQAMMFIPAEAVFAYINAYCDQIIEYAYKSKVWIVSPTTLTSTLTTIQVIVRNLERDKYAKIIHEQLNILGVEFLRYRERWDKLSKHMDGVSKDMKDIHVTSDKIAKKFENISMVDYNIIEKENF